MQDLPIRRERTCSSAARFSYPAVLILPACAPPLTWYVGFAGSALLLPPPDPERALTRRWPAAEPAATPAAVVAIWAIRPGPWAGAGAIAAGGGWAGAGAWEIAGLQMHQFIMRLTLTGYWETFMSIEMHRSQSFKLRHKLCFYTHHYNGGNKANVYNMGTWHLTDKLVSFGLRELKVTFLFH